MYWSQTMEKMWMENACQKFNIKKPHTTAYHPEADGMGETDRTG